MIKYIHTVFKNYQLYVTQLGEKYFNVLMFQKLHF